MSRSYENNTNLQRIGQVLVRCFWLEKRLVDLILLKIDPSLRDDFNLGIISNKHAVLRLEWHKHTFSFVIDRFVKDFPEIEKKDKQHIANLYFLNEVRDLLSHGDISYHRNNVLYVAKSIKRLEKLDNLTVPAKTGVDDGTRVLNLSEGNAFVAITKILNDWEKIIEAFANFFGVNTEKIK